MHSDASQVSRTQTPCAISAGYGATTWVFYDPATPSRGDDPPVRGQRDRYRYGSRAGTLRDLPRWSFAARLGRAALQPPPDLTAIMLPRDELDLVSPSEASDLAYGLRLMRVTARAALSVSTARGQLTCWRRAIPDLSEDYIEGSTTLDAFQDRMVEQIEADYSAITPHLARLNADQPSKKCWARPVPEGAARGTWTGRDPWITHAYDYLTPLMASQSTAISSTNLRSLLTSLASLASPTGRGVTASHQTIARLAIKDHGCALALSTATQRIRTIRRLLEAGGFHLTHAVGGHLTSLERAAAEAHHGGQQRRCGSTCDLALPQHLRPTPPSTPHTPDPHMGERLKQRDHDYRESRKKPVTEELESTYDCVTGLSLSFKKSGVTHTRAYAREENFSSKNIKISRKTWAIADTLTRNSKNSAERGPYSHLIGTNRATMSLKACAQLLEELTPTWASLKDVMRGLVAAATGKTGYVSLGLKTRPNSAWAWFKTVLESITWDTYDTWPAWSAAAREFGVDWRGTRHRWAKIQAAIENPDTPTPEPEPCDPQVRRSAMDKIRASIAAANSII